MKTLIMAAALCCVFCVNQPSARSQEILGDASWYGRTDLTDPWVHTRTASGAPFDENGFTCAMRSRDFGKYYRVTNVANGKSVVVKHTDYGPAKSWKNPKTGRVIDLSGRVIDLSKAAYEKIADLKTGVIRVRVEAVSK